MRRLDLTIAEQDQSIAEALERDKARLQRFVRLRVLDNEDVEDILQDVFYELIEAYRLMKPAEQITGWLFRVARNRITDLFRRRKTSSLDDPVEPGGEDVTFGDLLPSPDAGPEAVFARELLFEALDEALEELPENQRKVFIAHEFEGLSFKELSAQTGASVNTLLARKRYAVQHLRERLLEIKQRYGN